MTDIWNIIFLNPLLNVMIVLADFLLGSFGLAIIVLTIIVRLVILPVTLKQLRSTKAMQELQPKLVELQKKYAKDRQRLSQETMLLYKEHGINPLGCIWPMLIQLPVWIALFQSIRQALAATPEELLSLSNHLYSWAVVNQTVPLESNFLWLNLAIPDPFYILPILVGVTMWVQQKMTTQSSTDPAQKKAGTMMQVMFPLMFAFITLSFPSGLGVYFVVSAIVGIIIQYFVTGWGGLVRAKPSVIPTYKQARKMVEEDVIESQVVDEEKKEQDETDSYFGTSKGLFGDKKLDDDVEAQIKEKGIKDGRIRSKRKDSRRSDRRGHR